MGSSVIQNRLKLTYFQAEAHRHEIAFSVVKHGGASLREKKLLTCASSELSPISTFKRLLRGRNEENEPFLSETQLVF